jgi:hypothetical protein
VIRKEPHAGLPHANIKLLWLVHAIRECKLSQVLSLLEFATLRRFCVAFQLMPEKALGLAKLPQIRLKRGEEFPSGST